MKGSYIVYHKVGKALEQCEDNHKDGDCENCPLFSNITLVVDSVSITLCPCELLNGIAKQINTNFLIKDTLNGKD